MKNLVKATAATNSAAQTETMNVAFATSVNTKMLRAIKEGGFAVIASKAANEVILSLCDEWVNKFKGDICEETFFFVGKQFFELVKSKEFRCYPEAVKDFFELFLSFAIYKYEGQTPEEERSKEDLNRFIGYELFGSWCKYVVKNKKEN